MKNKKFRAIREEIRKKRESPQGQQSWEVGKERQERMKFFLKELKKEKRGIICDFLQTDDLSFQDIAEGIDFFIVVVDGTHKFYPLSVTGEGWVEEHKHVHPEIPVIGITESDTAASIKNKIMEAISQNK